MNFKKQTNMGGKSGTVRPFAKKRESNESIYLNVELAHCLDGFARCDAFIDKDEKAILFKGNDAGEYSITRIARGASICTCSLLKGEKIADGRIYDVEAQGDGCIIWYGGNRHCEEDIHEGH